MEGGTKIIVVVVLIVAVVAFVWWRLSSTEVVGGPKPPTEVRNRPRKMVDEKTFEVIERTKPEWDELYSEELDRWRNPDTGEYTIVPGIKCDSCGKLVPVKKLSEEEKEGLSEEQIGMRSEQLMRQYVCPHCEGRVYQ